MLAWWVLWRVFHLIGKAMGEMNQIVVALCVCVRYNSDSVGFKGGLVYHPNENPDKKFP